MKITFNLKKHRNQSNELSILLLCNYGYSIIDDTGKKKYKTFKYSTKLKIEPYYWDENIQRATKKYCSKYGKDLNTDLNNIETTINNVYRKSQIEGVRPTHEQLRYEMIISLETELFINNNEKKR